VAVYVLNMGQQVKVVDLAERLIRLSGWSGRDVDITFTGIRPGERLQEALLAHDGPRFRSVSRASSPPSR
jgi:FlaA1/EpsC-like NDP-sugar epimerase